jgi:hypothetical protein
MAGKHRALGARSTFPHGGFAAKALGRKMRMRRLILISAGALLVVALLLVWFAPLIVAGGLRIWAQRAAQAEGLRLELGEIEAPLLRPVIVRNLRVTSDPALPFQIECTAPRLELSLNLAALVTGSKRMLRHLQIDGLTLNIRRLQNNTEPARRPSWAVFENLRADSFKFSGVNLHLENGDAALDVRDGGLTGSELEAGTLTAAEINIAAPWLRKTLYNLRGATSWQENRLSLGALSLVRGLDIDTLTIDLSQIGESRIGLDVNVDAFGGKIRAHISSDDRSGKRIWDVAGNGSGVSLAQMSDALEWNDRASGSLHASKFTFRGEINDLLNATAAVWAEISGLTWRDRTADTVMIGASLYNREVQLEQLFIKQRNNQLTLSGEFGWPEKSAGSILPVFRGDLNASIRDLGEFARLFGWRPSDFAGQLSANGRVSAREGKLGGELSVSGASLLLFGSPIESLEARLGLEESRVTITQLELRQTGDFFHGEGSFAIAGDRSYNGAFQTSVGEIANYRGFVPKEIFPFPVEGAVAAEWKGRGANDGGSGTFHARARNLRLASGALLAFEGELEADYSPQNIFFRQFHLWNEHADLSAFVDVAKDYFQFQDLNFSLNGRWRLAGNVFLPISARKIQEDFSWLAALNPDPFFDVDVTLDALDLGELAAAVETKPDLAGQATGHFQLSGTPVSLQGKTEFHLRDLVWDNSPSLSADLDVALALGMLNLKANAVARGSEPVKVEGAIPLQLEKRPAEYAVATDGPLSLTAEFPAVFMAKLPAFISRGVFTSGILSGSLAMSGSVQHPLVTGRANLVDGQLLRGSSISAGISFKERNAVIDFAHFKERDADVSARGEIVFEDISDIRMTLSPNVSLTPTMSLAAEDCVGDLSLFASPAVTRLAGSVNQISLRGNFFGSGWTISLSQATPPGSEQNDAVISPQTFRLCRDGKTLSLGSTPALFP